MGAGGDTTGSREGVARLRERLGADPTFQAEAKDVLGGYPVVADAGLAERVRAAYTSTTTHAPT